MTSSGNGSCCARLSSGAAWTKYEIGPKLWMLGYTSMRPTEISPLRGSLMNVCASFGVGTQRTTE